jgi:hypothetical protein
VNPSGQTYDHPPAFPEISGCVICAHVLCGCVIPVRWPFGAECTSRWVQSADTWSGTSNDWATRLSAMGSADATHTRSEPGTARDVAVGTPARSLRRIGVMLFPLSIRISHKKEQTRLKQLVTL